MARQSERVALYGRVSTSGRGQSVETQLRDLRLEADRRGWTIAGEYPDEGVSGALLTRPALDALLDDADRGRFGAVIVWRLDRLGRSLQHLLTVLDRLRSARVGFVSLRDPGIDTTSPQGRLLLQILGAFAEFERELIRERVIAGVRRAQSLGKHCGRPKVEFDLRPALALLREDRGLTEVAKILDVSRTTLRRRLAEAGEWPRAHALSTDNTNKSNTVGDE